MLGDEGTALYSSIWASGSLASGAITTNWEVIRINPRSGGISDVAQLMLPAFCQGPDDTGPADAVIYGGCTTLCSRVWRDGRRLVPGEALESPGHKHRAASSTA